MKRSGWSGSQVAGNRQGISILVAADRRQQVLPDAFLQGIIVQPRGHERLSQRPHVVIVVVTADGCEVITNYPSDRLISCGLPGCEVY